jgi:hypothetical protein
VLRPSGQPRSKLEHAKFCVGVSLDAHACSGKAANCVATASILYLVRLHCTTATAGSASKGSNCYAAEGSYQQTCSPGIWAVKGDALDEDCWLCAKCPSDGGPEATSCTQAFDYCSDISNDLQKIACHGGMLCVVLAHALRPAVHIYGCSSDHRGAWVIPPWVHCQPRLALKHASVTSEMCLRTLAGST